MNEEQAIEILDNDIRGMMPCHASNDADMMALDLAIDALREKTEHKWIPANKPPKIILDGYCDWKGKSARVIMVDDLGNIETGQYEYNGLSDDKYEWCWDDGIFWDVTHWMTCPEPPKD